jgi:predicted RNA-binding Zn-ribbon protein involved in translation (DUF1610 family)
MGTTEWVIVGVVIAGVVGLAVSGYRFAMKKARIAKAEEILHFRCPGCKRRLRFRARQAGNKGKCSHCGHDIVFPHPSQSID